MGDLKSLKKSRHLDNILGTLYTTPIFVGVTNGIHYLRTNSVYNLEDNLERGLFYAATYFSLKTLIGSVINYRNKRKIKEQINPKLTRDNISNSP